MILNSVFRFEFYFKKNKKAMKKMSIAFLLVLFFLSSAQIQRFTYEYKYIADSTNRADIKTETMILDIGKKGSKYYSYERFAEDSIMNSKFGNQNSFKRSFSNKGLVFDKVSKEYPSYKTYLHTSLSSVFLKVEESSSPIWQIFPDKEKIGNYQAQKATTSYMGRNWIAWFCTDLPFQDGPYKFYGLPGLIVKIEDTNKTHTMILMGNAAVNEDESGSKSRKILYYPLGDVSVNNQQFNKLWREYVKNPTKSYRQQIANATVDANGNSSFNFVDASGNKLDPNEQIKRIEERFKEKLKKDNNRLDLELFRY